MLRDEFEARPYAWEGRDFQSEVVFHCGESRWTDSIPKFLVDGAWCRNMWRGAAASCSLSNATSGQEKKARSVFPSSAVVVWKPWRFWMLFDGLETSSTLLG